MQFWRCCEFGSNISKIFYYKILFYYEIVIIYCTMLLNKDSYHFLKIICINLFIFYIYFFNSLFNFTRMLFTRMFSWIFRILSGKSNSTVDKWLQGSTGPAEEGKTVWRRSHLCSRCRVMLIRSAESGVPFARPVGQQRQHRSASHQTQAGQTSPDDREP